MNELKNYVITSMPRQNIIIAIIIMNLLLNYVIMALQAETKNTINAIIIVYIITVDLHYHGTTSRGEKTNKSCMRKKKEQT